MLHSQSANASHAHSPRRQRQRQLKSPNRHPINRITKQRSSVFDDQEYLHSLSIISTIAFTHNPVSSCRAPSGGVDFSQLLAAFSRSKGGNFVFVDPAETFWPTSPWSLFSWDGIYWKGYLLRVVEILLALGKGVTFRLVFVKSGDSLVWLRD